MKFFIILNCIIAYSRAIRLAKVHNFSSDEIESYLKFRHMDKGVCKYILVKFKICVYGRKWVRRNIPVSSLYWCGIEPAIENLETRLKILKKELWKL